MKRIDEWAFFRKPSGQKAYHSKCIRCIHKCKQSWRVKWIDCPRFSRADCTKASEKTLGEKKQDKGELARYFEPANISPQQRTESRNYPRKQEKSELFVQHHSDWFFLQKTSF